MINNYSGNAVVDEIKLWEPSLQTDKLQKYEFSLKYHTFPILSRSKNGFSFFY